MFLLPLGSFFIDIMIAVWVLLMRRIGGGAGPGGQIFNIGKSRAQIFEGGKSTNVTFNDVAGLEGAKEELAEIVDTAALEQARVKYLGKKSRLCSHWP